MEFKVLGPLEVLSDGQPLQLGPPQQRALLALLLLNANQVVATDRLAEELWPAEVPKTASKAIQVYVSSLRKAFGTSRDALETRGNGYVLHVEAGELDLHEFELLLERAKAEEPGARVATLRSALSLWRGAPLADLTYERFAQPEAARLEALRLLAQEERIEAELALGRGPDLVPELDALVAESPLQERPRAQLMLALYRSGRQADALDVFREGRRILDEELGLEAGPALRELESAILRQDPELVVPATAPAPSIVALSEHREAREAVVSLAAALARALATETSSSRRSSRLRTLATPPSALESCVVHSRSAGSPSASRPSPLPTRLQTSSASGCSKTPICSCSPRVETRWPDPSHLCLRTRLATSRRSSRKAAVSATARLSCRSVRSSTIGRPWSSEPGLPQRWSGRSS